MTAKRKKDKVFTRKQIEWMLAYIFIYKQTGIKLAEENGGKRVYVTEVITKTLERWEVLKPVDDGEVV